jgi:hypothetical protein
MIVGQRERVSLARSGSIGFRARIERSLRQESGFEHMREITASRQQI